MLVGQRIGEFFSIDREIGHGAMGTVYRGTYIKTGQQVAIKVISPGQLGNDRNVARFEREVAILKQLKHPNIVRLYAHGKVKGTPFFAMEFIEGESLDRVLERRSRYSWEEVIAIGKQLCAALQHAHEQGIIHRDLKPSNVMVLADGTVKLTDFGIAKDPDLTTLTAANCAVGTAAYMSPEQCRGERVLTHKSDLYCLGVMFYELVTGKRPFVADTPLTMFLMHTEGKCERPSRLALDIPIWFDTLICQLMEKKPEHRPRDAATVARALADVEEKVAAQKSAGVEVVRARVVDRPLGGRKPDEEDREAARTLGAAVGKKKRKPRTRPFHQRTWVRAVGLAAVLVLFIGTVVGLIVLVNRPEDPDALFQQAKALMDKDDLYAHNQARDGPIPQYLRYHGSRDHEQTRTIRAWKDDIEVADRERKLRNDTLYKFLPADDERATDAKAKAKAAVEHEEETGDLAEAAKRWRELEKLSGESDRNLQLYGLLASRRLKEIQEVDRLEVSLREKLRQAYLSGNDVKPDSDLEARALRAFRYEVFGDRGSAGERWRDVKLKAAQMIDQQRQADKVIRSRLWPLIGAKKVGELKVSGTAEEKKKARLDLLDKRLGEVKVRAATQVGEARFICRELIALYEKDDDEEVAARVKQARNLLETELK